MVIQWKSLKTLFYNSCVVSDNPKLPSYIKQWMKHAKKRQIKSRIDVFVLRLLQFWFECIRTKQKKLCEMQRHTVCRIDRYLMKELKRNKRAPIVFCCFCLSTASKKPNCVIRNTFRPLFVYRNAIHWSPTRMLMVETMHI